MFLHVHRLLGMLLTVMLSVLMARASSHDARSPQDVDGDETRSLHFYTPTPVRSIPSWYPTTSSAAQPSASVSFAFGDILDMIVCGQSDITWAYAGDTSYNMGIAAMPIPLASSSLSGTSPTMITILSGGLGVGSYSWSPVNVPAGEYVLEVSIPNADLLYFSETFTVFNSSDLSCLASSSSTTSPPASSTGDVGSSTSVASATSTSAGDTSGAPIVGAVSDGPSISSGGIAGVVIGGVIFVGALIAIFLLLRRCLSNRAVGAPRGGLFEKRRPKGAVSIGSRGGSVSSTHGAPARGLGSSFGMAPHYDLNDPSQSALGHGMPYSYEDVTSPSLNGEKPITHSPAEFDMALPAAVHRTGHTYRDSYGSTVSGSPTTVGSPAGMTNHYRPSRHTSVQYTSDPFGSIPPTPSPRPSGDYQVLSGSHSQVPVALFSPSSATYTPRVYGSPGVPRDISISSSSTPDLPYELDVAAPSAAIVAPLESRRAPPAPPAAVPSPGQPARRSKSASARKPVPVYEPSVVGESLELVEPSTPHSASFAGSSYYNSSADQHSRGSLTRSSTGNDWSSAAAHSHSAPSGTSPTSSGSYLPHSSYHSLSGFAGRTDMPELNHKSSFGDRQLHVLIPDPPPQQMQ